MAAPSGVLQRRARSSLMFGATWMSAYMAWPERSVAMVLTHGTPWVLDRTPAISPVLRAWPSSNQVLRPRRLPWLASRTAYALEVVHANGSPSTGETTGPYRVEYSVRRTGDAPSTCTVTVRLVMASGLPST